MKVKHIEGYDCIDDNLEIVLKNKNLDLRKIFSNLWYFEFDENSETLGKGLMKSNNNKYERLKENFNIDYKIYENEHRNNEIELKEFGPCKKLEIEGINNIIRKKCNKDHVIIVELDTFKYKFDKGFNKYIGTHSCIILNLKKDKAQIIDVWYGLYNIEIEYEDLLNAITRIIILDISNIKQKDFDKKQFKKCIISEKSIKEMKKFFEKINKINLKEEYLNLNFDMVFKAPIDKGLRKTIMNRQRFAHYLYYLSKELNDKKFEKIGDYIYVISMEWTKLRIILLQSFFLDKNLSISQLNEITSNILEKEKKIKKEIEEIKW